MIETKQYKIHESSTSIYEIDFEGYPKSRQLSYDEKEDNVYLHGRWCHLLDNLIDLGPILVDRLRDVLIFVPSCSIRPPIILSGSSTVKTIARYKKLPDWAESKYYLRILLLEDYDELWGALKKSVSFEDEVDGYTKNKIIVMCPRCNQKHYFIGVHFGNAVFLDKSIQLEIENK